MKPRRGYPPPSEPSQASFSADRICQCASDRRAPLSAGPTDPPTRFSSATFLIWCLSTSDDRARFDLLDRRSDQEQVREAVARMNRRRVAHLAPLDQSTRGREVNGMAYRRRRTHDTWHWCRNCSNWPRTTSSRRPSPRAENSATSVRRSRSRERAARSQPSLGAHAACKVPKNDLAGGVRSPRYAPQNYRPWPNSRPLTSGLRLLRAARASSRLLLVGSETGRLQRSIPSCAWKLNRDVSAGQPRQPPPERHREGRGQRSRRREPRLRWAGRGRPTRPLRSRQGRSPIRLP